MLQTLRTAVPSVWFGLIVALSFIETPLKFLAPDITLEIALGIGRLVLTAANIAGAVLLIAMTLLSFARPRIGRGAWIVVGGLWLALLVQVLVIRPPLNARTDLILAGGDPGSSPLHIFYIVVDVVILALLIAYVVMTRVRTAATAMPPVEARTDAEASAQ